jgi:hypothetical protein
MREFWMLDLFPQFMALTALLPTTSPTAVHWQVKRTGNLTDRWERDAGWSSQTMLMPGSNMEDAEEGTCVQTFCTPITGLEIWKSAAAHSRC